jgi:hypothetical protein
MLGPIGSAVLGPNDTASSGEHNGFGDAFEVGGSLALPAVANPHRLNYPKGRSADASS